jgi:hypothetical protein
MLTTQGKQNLMSTHRHVEVTLLEHSTAGNPPKKFAGQTAEIVREPDTVQTGVDGHASSAHHPTEIFWHGGTAKSLANITNVRIVADNGEVLINDDQLCTTFQVPKDGSGSVKFEVLSEGP